MKGISLDTARQNPGRKLEKWRGEGGQVLYVERLSDNVVKRLNARQVKQEMEQLSWGYQITGGHPYRLFTQEQAEALVEGAREF